MFGSSNIKLVLKKKDEIGFTSVQEFLIFLYIAENPKMTIKIITNENNLSLSYTKKVLSVLKQKELINSVDDLTDKGNSKLKRQLYFLSQNGQNKYSQLLSAEM